MLTLAAKLRHLIQRLPADQRSTRKISAAIRALPGHTRGGSQAAINNLVRGLDDNPTVATVTALAQVLEAPPAFLLPGWDDLRALSVLQGNHLAVDIVRHLEGLPEQELGDFLKHLKSRRTELGLPANSELIHIEQQTPEDSVTRDPRRRSAEESAKYAADSLEGL